MRVNIYAEELTQRLEYLRKTVNGRALFGVRFYLELPVTIGTDATGSLRSVKGPFQHGEFDDDSSAVTFWASSPGELQKLFGKAESLAMKGEIAEESHSGR